MPVIPTGFGQVNFMFEGGGLPTGGEVTFGFDHTGYGGSPTTAAEDLGTAFLDVLANLNAAVTFARAETKYGPSTTGPSGVFTFGVAGGNAGAGGAPNETWLVRKITGDGGRAGRGRCYLPGITDTDVDSAGNIDAPEVSALNADLVTFLGACDALNLNLMVLHGVGSPISSPSLITDLVADSRTATQRRRLRR